MLHTVRLRSALTLVIIMTSCVQGGIVPFEPEISPSPSNILPLATNEKYIKNQSNLSHAQAYSLRKYVPIGMLLDDAANSTFNFHNNSKSSSHGNHAIKLFHRFTSRTRTVVRNAFWRVRNIAKRVHRYSPPLSRFNENVTILALFHDYVVQNESVVNTNSISIVSSPIPSVSPVDLSPTPSSSVFVMQTGTFATPPLIGAREHSTNGEISSSPTQTLDTEIDHIKDSDHDVPLDMRYWAVTDAIPSSSRLTDSKDGRNKLRDQVIPAFDAPSPYIGRRLSVVDRNAQFEPSHIVGQHAVEQYLKPLADGGANMRRSLSYGTNAWSYEGSEHDMKGFTLQPDHFVDRSAMPYQSFESHDGTYRHSSSDDLEFNHGISEQDFISHPDDTENDWDSSHQLRSGTFPETSRDKEGSKASQQIENKWGTRSETDESERLRRDGNERERTLTTSPLLENSTTVDESIGNASKDNVTQLSTMVYKIAMIEHVESLAAAPCREVIKWMPDVMRRLESHVNGFEFFCIDIISPMEVKSESGTAMTTVSSDSNEVDDDLREAFGGDISGGFVRMGLNEIDEHFPKGLDLVVTWMGSQQWGVKDIWRFAKGLRRSQTRLWLLSNDAVRANGESDNGVSNDAHALNVRKSPLLFNEPSRVIGKVSEDSKKQLLLYDMARVRDNF